MHRIMRYQCILIVASLLLYLDNTPRIPQMNSPVICGMQYKDLPTMQVKLQVARGRAQFTICFVPSIPRNSYLLSKFHNVRMLRWNTPPLHLVFPCIWCWVAMAIQCPVSVVLCYRLQCPVSVMLCYRLAWPVGQC